LIHEEGIGELRPYLAIIGTVVGPAANHIVVRVENVPHLANSFASLFVSWFNCLVFVCVRQHEFVALAVRTQLIRISDIVSPSAATILLHQVNNVIHDLGEIEILRRIHTSNAKLRQALRIGIGNDAT
jgi:hypothetical protein